MAYKLVECVANFSEGRRLDVIQEIVDAIDAVKEVHVLDRHTDEDHNRTVITFVGAPDAVSQAAYASIAVAAQKIDLEKHQGEHPRIGATDVVPFVPISGVTMEDCVGLAKDLGERVGRELKIPVYLYERAATRPERVNLEKIRKGEYEALRESIVTDPEREPDYGPAKLGTAGATVIGARAPLIAYNVYLKTDDVSIAKEIARKVRQSSGGLPYVKALGLMVDDKAQVSMNLTDYTQTSIPQVMELIRTEADGLGTQIDHAELVGLIPQRALIEAAQGYLQLDEFETDQVLENRIFDILGSPESDRRSFLDSLAAATPTPGGGSASAYAGAMAASLVGMVSRLSMGKKKYAEIEDRMSEIAAIADEMRQSLATAVDRDAEAFDTFLHAMRLPKDSEEEKAAREHAMEKALQRAAEIPLEVAEQSVELMSLAAEVAEKGNVNALTDVGSAGAMARAAFQSARMNVMVNAAGISNKEAAKGWLKALQSMVKSIQIEEDRLHETLRQRNNLAL